MKFFIKLLIFFVLSINSFAQLSQADREIAKYLEKACLSTNLENIVLYDLEKNKLFDLSQKRISLVFATSMNIPEILKRTKLGGKWVIAHCHIVDYNLPSRYLSKDSLEKYDSILLSDKNIVRKYFLSEIPSGYEYNLGERGDIWASANLEMLSYKNNKMTEIYNRLVVVELGQPTKVLSFGFSSKNMIFLREYASNLKKNSLHENGVIKENMEHYNLGYSFNRITSNYIKKSCVLLETKTDNCEYINPNKLMKLINDSGKFFIKPLGTYSISE